MKSESKVKVILAALQMICLMQCNCLPPVVMLKDSADNICPSEGNLQATIDELRGRIQEKLVQEAVVTTTKFPDTTTSSPSISDNHFCGPGNWRRFFFFNMSDPSQSCPREWLFSSSPNRACTGEANSCVPTYVSSGGHAYRKVCGMLAGVGVGHPDGFFRHLSTDMQSIEQNYLDGVSITYGPAGSRQHIWSLVLGHTHRCPCDMHNSTYQQPSPPSEVGNNYFCSSVPLNFHQSTPVWQGVNCSANNPCCSHNNPPIFKAQLTAMTTQTMELRICSDESTGDERLYVILADIYVQ